MIAYFVDRSIDGNRSDFWAAASRAELLLTRRLLGEAIELDEIIDAYARATAVRAPASFKVSVRNQLALYARVGDPEEVIEPLRALFPS